jgi:hypothetical protein
VYTCALFNKNKNKRRLFIHHYVLIKNNNEKINKVNIYLYRTKKCSDDTHTHIYIHIYIYIETECILCCCCCCCCCCSLLYMCTKQETLKTRSYVNLFVNILIDVDNIYTISNNSAIPSLNVSNTNIYYTSWLHLDHCLQYMEALISIKIQSWFLIGLVRDLIYSYCMVLLKNRHESRIIFCDSLWFALICMAHLYHCFNDQPKN